MESDKETSWNPQQILVLTAITIVVITSVIGNGFVIATWFVCKRLRTPSNALLLSLAITDLLSSVITAPLTSTLIINNGWAFSKTLCKFYTITGYMFTFVSSNHLVLIAIGRLRILIEGVPYLQRRSIRHAARQVLLLWGLSTLVVLPVIINWDEIMDISYCRPNLNSIFGYLTVCADILFPLILQVIIYLCVFRVLRRKIWQRVGKPNLHLKSAEEESQIETTGVSGVELQATEKVRQNEKAGSAAVKERRAVITLGILILAYTVSWTPYLVFVLLELTKVDIPFWYFYMMLVLGWLNVCINPIIYVWRNADFQDAVKMIGRKIYSALKIY